MATGTSAGLLDSSDHAQSVFKHAIIRQYMRPFLAMTGSTSEQGRVVVMDGFAGRGRYPDGAPASAGDRALRHRRSRIQRRSPCTSYRMTKTSTGNSM